jgi:hypothetical protein
MVMVMGIPFRFCVVSQTGAQLYPVSAQGDKGRHCISWWLKINQELVDFQPENG